MSITKTNSSRSAYATTEYVVWGLGEEGRKNHEQNTPRAKMFISDFGVTLDGALGASRRYARELAERGREIQCYTIIHSFPKDEFDINNPEHQRKATELGYELAKRAHPNSKVQTWLHVDSQGGNVHTHTDIMNEDESTGQSIQSNKQQPQIAKLNDILMREEGLQVARDNRLERAMSQSAFWSRRRSAELEAEISELEMMPKRTKKQDKDLEEMQERLRVIQAPSQWEEELQNTLDDIFMNDAFKTHQQFIDACQEKGIEARFRYKKSTGEVTGLSYKFTDSSDHTQTRRSSKLGTEYDASAVEEVMSFYIQQDKENEENEQTRQAERESIEQLSASLTATEFGDNRATENNFRTVEDEQRTNSALDSESDGSGKWEQLSADLDGLGETLDKVRENERRDEQKRRDAETAGRNALDEQNRSATQRTIRKSGRFAGFEYGSGSAKDDYEPEF